MRACVSARSLFVPRVAASPIVVLLAAIAGCGGGDAESEGPLFVLGPAGATTLDDLVVTMADGKPGKYEFSWQLDGEDVDVSGERVPADMTAKGEEWTVTVTRGRRSASATIEVGNLLPTCAVRVEPTAPNAGQDVVATGVASDEDGDPTFVEYAWSRNGQGAGFSGRTLPAAGTRRGETWSVTVTPYDGELPGQSCQISFTIQNAPPTMNEVRLSNLAPLTEELLTVVGTGTDLDNDAVRYEYRWLVNGVVVSGATTNSLAGAEKFDADDEVWAEMRGVDGTGPGPWRASAVATVGNSPPTPPGVEVTPAAPFADEDLVCTLTETSKDPDGDKVAYKAEWMVDGAPFTASITGPGGVEGDTVPAAYLEPEETWTCTMIASDPAGAAASASQSVSVAPRSGCLDGTSEAEWNSDLVACKAASKLPWQTFLDTPSDYCAAGWTIAGPSIVNTELNGPGYKDVAEYAFDGGGCDGFRHFATTNDSLFSARASCVWRRGHYKLLSSTSTTVDGVVCARIPEDL